MHIPRMPACILSQSSFGIVPSFEVLQPASMCVCVCLRARQRVQVGVVSLTLTLTLSLALSPVRFSISPSHYVSVCV